MEILNVLAAAVASFIVGGVWYMVLSKPWLKASGIACDEKGKPLEQESMMPFVVCIVAAILVAGMMRHMFQMAGIVDPMKGLVSGLGVGLFFITPWTAMNYAFGKRSPMLTVIDGGYAIIGCSVIGLVLNLF